MVERDTKGVLTVIAAALVALVVPQAMPRATAADGSGCGEEETPCFVIPGTFERASDGRYFARFRH